MPARPNLLFIIADQLRHDFLGCYGAPFIATPNIDRVAREGVLYEQAYSPHPLCHFIHVTHLFSVTYEYISTVVLLTV